MAGVAPSDLGSLGHLTPSHAEGGRRRDSRELRATSREPTTNYVRWPPAGKPATRNRQPEAGGWELETGNWKLATGNWQLETGNWKLMTDD